MIYLVNLVPDTLVIELCDEEGIPRKTIYEGYIERGDFRIRVGFDKFVLSGVYYFRLTVGEDRQTKKMMYLK